MASTNPIYKYIQHVFFHRPRKKSEFKRLYMLTKQYMMTVIVKWKGWDAIITFHKLCINVSVELSFKSGVYGLLWCAYIDVFVSILCFYIVLKTCLKTPVLFKYESVFMGYAVVKRNR